ncbi:unnamed protein product [Ectocarpus sp. 8 AP-2014]
MANFATLESLKKGDEEEKKGNAYYAGGARGAGRGGSGLNVMGPPPDDEGEGEGGNGDPHVQEIFRRAETGGPPGEEGGNERTITITMYNGGFTVDDGPFRRLDDPANKDFLKDLASGLVPKELEAGATPGKGTDVKLVDKQNEDYVAPPYVAFGGDGQTMGASTVAEGAVMTATGAPEASEAPEVDASQPSTTLQIRLHDGRRVRAQLNMHHTVRHIQAIIAREGAGGGSYMLMAGYPPAPLSDSSQTLEQAGLKGASITQKLA